jgi:putative SOS response-associated peptidase YedK
MCGRFSLTVSDIGALARAWGAEVEAALLAGWKPRYNVAPGNLVPLLWGPAGRRRLVAATFGLPAAGGGLHINARAETAGRRPAFRQAMLTGRAVVPADGFYEWEGPPAARRPTWFHRADGAPLLLAAVAEPGLDGRPAFAILTTAAIAPVARLHDRMPVVLPPDRLEAWLSPGPPPPLPAPSEVALIGRPLSPRVNSPAHDDPECLAPREEPAQRRLL